MQFGGILVLGVFTRGDIGTSLVTSQPVLGLVASRAGVTPLLVVLSVVFTVLIAVPLAMLAATHKDGPLDHLVRVVPTIGMAMPAFWVGLILILRVRRQAALAAGRRRRHRARRAAAQPGAARPDGGPGHVAAAGPALREQLVEVLDADFVVTLRAARLPSVAHPGARAAQRRRADGVAARA